MDDTQKLQDAITDRLRQTNVSLPGVVESYDADTRKANVKPTIREKFGDGTVLDLPVITNVPVVMPGTQAARITLPVAAGDEVVLIFSQRSLDLWLSEGGITDAGDIRMHSMSDAIAIPGLFPFNGVPSSGVNIELTGTRANIGAGGTLQKLLNDAAATMYDGHTHAYNPDGSAVPAFTSVPATGVAAAPTAEPMTDTEKTDTLRAQ